MNVAAIREGARLPGGIAVPDDLSIAYPVSPPIYISQAFGVVSITGILHQGVDIVVGNVPTLAVHAGDIVSIYPYGRDVPGLGSDGSPGGYGNTVLVEHVTPSGWRFRTYHCHLLPETITVHAGDHVVEGQLLGVTDTTGISTGNHEHFELRLDDIWPTRLDPMPVFNRVIQPDPEDLFAMLNDEGKALAEAIFNDPDSRANLVYALAVMRALGIAKPGAPAMLVGGSLVTLGPDGRKATELDGRALAEIHRAKQMNPTTHEEEWDEAVLDSLVLQRIRTQRQWLAAQGQAGGTEPPAPGSPPQP